MTESTAAGDDARTETDAPRVEKPGVYATLTALQRDLLHVVAALANDPNGREVQDALGDYRESVNHPTVYTNLNALADADLIAKREVNGRANAYALTTEGEQALRARAAWTTSCTEGSA